MTVYFECTTRTAMDKATLFDLSRSIDTHAGSMSRAREKAVAGVTTGFIYLGEQVTWQAWHFGVPVRMTSRITAMEVPDFFVDEQVNGPFRHFKHLHEFRLDGGATVMVDRIEFSAPFGLLGLAAEKLFLARYMRKLIETRNRYLIADQPPGQ